MVIVRKLLLPTLSLFTLLLVGLVIFFAWNTSSSLEDQEDRYLRNQAEVFDQNLRSKSNMALALAKQIAGNPDVVQAFAEKDRLRLINLTLNAFKNVQPLYDLTEQQYVQEPALVLLRLQDIEKYGDDLSASRATLVTANASDSDVSGIELADDGLSVRGVAVLEGGAVSGVVDLGMALNQKSLLELKENYGDEWRILLSRQAIQKASYAGLSDMAPSPTEELLQLASTMEKPVLAPASAYQQAMAGETVISRVQQGERNYAVISFPLRDYSRAVIGVVDVLYDRSQTSSTWSQRIVVAASVGAIGLFLGILLFGLIFQRNLEPISQLTAAAQEFADGNLQRRLPEKLVRRAQGSNPDEIDQLTQSFGSMATQLRRLVGNLEERVAERTGDLERRTMQLRAVADIARDVTVVSDTQALLEQAVLLVRQRFDFYHAGIFLIDDSGEWAVLRAATGDAGRRMVEAGHRLRVGQVGIVGTATGSGQPHVSQDVDKDAAHYKNPMLPETRSEVAVPLRLGNKVVGALDVQSTRPNAFDEGDITVLQLLGDQVAIALNNARLIQELNRSMQELENAYGRVTQQTWSSYVRSSKQSPVTGYRYLPSGKSPAEQDNADLSQRTEAMEWQNLEAVNAGRLSSEALQALRSNTTVRAAAAGATAGAIAGAAAGATAHGTPGQSTLAVPIRLRGQGIGVIQLRFNNENLSPEVVDLLEDVSSRLGLVLESARLLHEAQRLAAREQQINWIANQMRSSVDLEAILQNTVRELGKALGARRTYIQLGQYSADTANAGDGSGSGAGEDDGDRGEVVNG